MNTLVSIGISLAAAASLTASSNGGPNDGPNGTNGEPPLRYADTKVTFKPGEGLVFDGGDEFGVSLRHIVQAEYSYSNFDGAPDQSGFNIRRARQDLRGHAFSRDVSFRIQIDHRDATSATLARDLWIDWEFLRNDSTSLGLRIGQQKTRSSLQFNAEGYTQMFTERSVVTNTFSGARSTGAMLHGRALDDEQLGFFAGIFNTDIAAGSLAAGEEGLNAGQNELNFIFGLNFDPNGSVGDVESWTEGELSHDGEMKSTIGASIYLGNEGIGGVDVETTQINLNSGVKLGNGVSTQGEIFFRSDDVDGGGVEADALGWYIQSTYALPQEDGKPQWACALRVAMVDFDDVPNLLAGAGASAGLAGTPSGFITVSGDVLEINATASALYHAHNLKSQVGLTYQQVNPDGAADLDNFGIEYLFTLVL